MSTNMIIMLSPQVKLKPVWPCCTVTSDRHAEGETPNKATEKRHKETLTRTSQDYKQQQSINPDAASYFQD